MTKARRLPPYDQALAGTLLAAREAVMAPIRPILREAGVTEQQWRVLRVLCDQGKMDLSNIAATAMLHPPSVTRILRELVDRKLVRRFDDPQDGRRGIVEVSKAGLLLVHNTAGHALRVLDGYAKAFGRGRLERLIAEIQEFKIVIAKNGNAQGEP